MWLVAQRDCRRGTSASCRPTSPPHVIGAAPTRVPPFSLKAPRLWGIRAAITFPLKALRAPADFFPDTGRPSCPPWMETGAHEPDPRQSDRRHPGEKRVERRGGQG